MNCLIILRKLPLMILFISIASSSHAKEQFPSTYKSSGEEMVLKGTGTKRVFLMKAFVAGLYSDDTVEAKDVLTNVPKRIEVSYFVNIPGEKLTKYTERMMEKNTTPQTLAMLEEQIKLMGKYFVDLKPGDRYALTYLPQTGTEFEYNGKVVGVIAGEDFAHALFSVWIGKNPMDKTIKNKILGL